MRSIYPIYKFISRPLPILRRHIPKGIDNPFNMSGCKVLLFVCRGCLHCVAWFSYWFDNLGFISEGNTYRRCAASSLPLWGNTDVASSDIRSRRHRAMRYLRGGKGGTMSSGRACLKCEEIYKLSPCLKFPASQQY